MRTATIDICGREYLLCFSARVVRAVTERYGGMEHIDEALTAEDQFYLKFTEDFENTFVNQGGRGRGE